MTSFRSDRLEEFQQGLIMRIMCPFFDLDPVRHGTDTSIELDRRIVPPIAPKRGLQGRRGDKMVNRKRGVWGCAGRSSVHKYSQSLSCGFAREQKTVLLASIWLKHVESRSDHRLNSE